jgi:hypothetical protein
MKFTRCIILGSLLISAFLTTGCQTKIEDYGSVTGNDQASLYREDPQLYQAEEAATANQTAPGAN